MATNEVHELAVRLTPEGGPEVRNELKNTREEFSTTTDEVGESTTQLDNFSKKWTGAGLAFAGTLGVLTAAVASRMPIISEISNSLDQVLTSLALSIDEDVRPELSGLSDDFSDLADDIDDADTASESFGQTARGLTDIAIDLVLEARAEETGDSKFETARRRLQEFVQGFFDSEEPVVVELDDIFDLPSIDTWSDEQLSKIGRFSADVGSLFDDASAFWRTALETGWELIVNDAKRFLNDLGQRIERRVNQIIEALNKIPGTNIGRVSIGEFQTRSESDIISRARARLAARRGDLDPMGGGRAGGVDSQDISRLIAALQSAENTTEFNVDNRTLGRAAGPALGDSVANLGR